MWGVYRKGLFTNLITSSLCVYEPMNGSVQAKDQKLLLCSDLESELEKGFTPTLFGIIFPSDPCWFLLTYPHSTVSFLAIPPQFSSFQMPNKLFIVFVHPFLLHCFSIIRFYELFCWQVVHSKLSHFCRMKRPNSKMPAYLLSSGGRHLRSSAPVFSL